MQKNYFKIFKCKHCEEIMTSNNKFHEHVRLHHNKTLRQRFVEKKDNHINLSISRLSISRSTFSITFKSMTTSTKSLYLFIIITKAQVARFIVSSVNFSITSMNSIAFKSSRRHESTCSIISRSTSMILKSSHHSINIVNASMICFFTFSSSSSQTSKLKHQKQHRKSYFIINNLFEMFVKKSSKRNMNIIQKKSTSSCFSEFRQFRQSR